MTKQYRIVARISELRYEDGGRPCSLYSSGDEFDLTIPEERAKVCRWAYNSLLPFIAVLEFGGTLPWEPDSERAFVACPDPHNVVVFELIRKEELGME
ncbi:MAG: TIGR04076 family protein [Candidatus Thorarchaeota archaeon]